MFTASVPPQELHGDVALIVIHGHDAVELAAMGPHEQRVGRPGTADVDAGFAGRRHGGSDERLFLVAEQAAVAGVRIEGRDADARRPAEQTRQQVVEQVDLLADGRRC